MVRNHRVNAAKLYVHANAGVSVFSDEIVVTTK